MKSKTSKVAMSRYLQLEKGELLHGDLIEIKTSKKYKKETMNLIRKNMILSCENPNLNNLKNQLLDVAIIIYVNRHKYSNQDLDNVAKLVLDSMKEKKGEDLCFMKDDKQIVRLLLYKLPRIENSDSDTSQLSISIRKHNPEKEMRLIECYRLLKKNKSMYLFTNWKHYPFLTEFILRYTKFRIRHLIVWRKHNFGLGWAFRHQYELILILEKGKPHYHLTNFSDVQTCSHINHNRENHPHQKPVDLIIKMIEHSSKEGDIILDPFCGSGSVCVACQQTGRKWIGIEIDEKYVEMAKKRIK
ncbi:MAG: DNA methyltransferase [Nanoarchaeota archaeon]|nr:DNA methyltransferase [Nanoarchaeota archaeon]